MTKPFEEITYADMNSPRWHRAKLFAEMTMSIMRDFLPRDRLILRHIEEQLLRLGWEGNIALINVPPECDEMDKLALERTMIEARVPTVVGR